MGIVFVTCFLIGCTILDTRRIRSAQSQVWRFRCFYNTPHQRLMPRPLPHEARFQIANIFITHNIKKAGWIYPRLSFIYLLIITLTILPFSIICVIRRAAYYLFSSASAAGGRTRRRAARTRLFRGRYLAAYNSSQRIVETCLFGFPLCRV